LVEYRGHRVSQRFCAVVPHKMQFKDGHLIPMS
jgi:hypothetical protein